MFWPKVITMYGACYTILMELCSTFSWRSWGRNAPLTRLVEYKVGQSENVNKFFLESYGSLPMVSKTAKTFVGQIAFYSWTPSQKTCQELSNKGSWIFVAYLVFEIFQKNKKLLFSKHGGMLHHWSFCSPSPFVPIFFWHFKD
jgi:hypothetical protein